MLRVYSKKTRRSGVGWVYGSIMYLFGKAGKAFFCALRWYPPNLLRGIVARVQNARKWSER